MIKSDSVPAMQSLFTRFLVLTLALFAITGCRKDFKLNGIVITPIAISPSIKDPAPNKVDITLKFQNENVISFGVSFHKHKLYLNNTYVGKSVTEEAVGLKQLSSTTQVVTFQIEKMDLLGQLTAAADAQNVTYRIDSLLYVPSGDDYTDIKTQNTGNLDLRPLKASK